MFKPYYLAEISKDGKQNPVRATANYIARGQTSGRAMEIPTSSLDLVYLAGEVVDNVIIRQQVGLLLPVQQRELLLTGGLDFCGEIFLVDHVDEDARQLARILRRMAGMGEAERAAFEAEVGEQVREQGGIEKPVSLNF
jgi:hypothetical protein